MSAPAPTGSTRDPHASLARRFWTETKRDKWQLLVFAGAALIAISKFWRGKPGITVLVVGVTLTALVGYINFRVQRGRNDESTELKEQLTRATAEKARLEQELAGAQSAVARIPDDAMFRLVTGLGLDTRGRASLFAARPGETTCRLVGRHSGNPAYCSSGRGTYPLDRGCIGRTWHLGEDEVTALPTAGGKRIKYTGAMEKYHNMSADDVANLTMFSRSFAGRRVTDLSGRENLGLVIIESLDPQGVSLDALGAQLTEDRLRELSEILHTMATVAPSATRAGRLGY